LPCDTGKLNAGAGSKGSFKDVDGCAQCRGLRPEWIWDIGISCPLRLFDSLPRLHLDTCLTTSRFPVLAQLQQGLQGPLGGHLGVMRVLKARVQTHARSVSAPTASYHPLFSYTNSSPLCTCSESSKTSIRPLHPLVRRPFQRSDAVLFSGPWLVVIPRPGGHRCGRMRGSVRSVGRRAKHMAPSCAQNTHLRPFSWVH
jgi:hypothetical protein